MTADREPAFGSDAVVIHAFESAWQSGSASRIADFLPPEAQGNPDLLAELVCIDLEHRLRSGEETRVEHYTAEFPVLAEDDLILLELIRTEWAFRRDAGPADLAPYLQRFPSLAAQLQLMFRLEFTGSQPVHFQGHQRAWRCAACEAPVDGRAAGATTCAQCGQPIAIGRYQLLQRVGEGAFGYVYRARDPKLDRVVAIKLPRSGQFLMPEESERFLRESRHAAQLDHPGIVRVFDAGRHEETPYIVSEFVDGQTLQELLAREEFDFREAAQAVLQISLAVAHAHERGVVHRDLKPSNVMISTTSTGARVFRVMDFGLARRSQSDVSVTIEGQAVGTPAYMSPEQARGDMAHVGPASDTYCLGVILFQLLCGELPFRGNVQELLQQVIHDDPPPPSRFRGRIPRDLETICLKAISREPRGRYGSVAAMAADLRRWLDGKPVDARRVGVAGRTWRWCKRRPAVASLLLVLALSITVGVAGITSQWRVAEAARLASEADLADALESVDRVLGHLGSDTLVDIPQAKRLRADVLNDALEFFERFRTRNPNDPRIAMQVARAHLQVGRIQAALGNTEKADQACRQAIATYVSIPPPVSGRPEWMEALAGAHAVYAGQLLSHQSDRAAAREQWQKCLVLRRRLHELHPDVGKYAARWATARADYARTLNSDESTAAEAEFDAAVRQLQRLAEAHVAIGYRRDLARVLNNFAIWLVKAGRHGKAEECREQAITLYEEILADDPTSESTRSLYASCCLQLVKSLRAESRLDAALEYQQKAVAAYGGLTEDFPATPRHRERFATVLAEVASLAVIQRRQADALAASEDAVRQWETLVAMFPHNTRYQSQLASALSRLADGLLDADRKSDAEDRLRQRYRLRQRLVTSDPQSPSRGMSLAVVARDLADLVRQSRSAKKKEEAEQLLQEAERITAGLSVEQILQADLSSSRRGRLLSSLASIADKKGDQKTLEQCLRARLLLAQQRLQANPEDLAAMSSLAKRWSSLAQLLRNTDRRAEAIDAWSEAVAIDRKLVQRDPDSATALGLMIGHSSSLGNALVAQDEAEAAVEVLSASLQLAQRLADERSNEGFRQTRLVLAYCLLGNAASRAGDYQQAREAYDRSIDLCGVLSRQTGMESFGATARNQAAWFFVTCPDPAFRDPNRALLLSQEAVSISPQDGSCQSTLGFALYETNQYEKAIEALNRSSELEETMLPLNLLLVAMAQARLKNFDAARGALETAQTRQREVSRDQELFDLYREQARRLLEAAPPKVQAEPEASPAEAPQPV